MKITVVINSAFRCPVPCGFLDQRASGFGHAENGGAFSLVQITDSYENCVIDIHRVKNKIKLECTVAGFMTCDHAEAVVNKTKKRKKMGRLG